uniref:Sugar phosphate transporter domain-containing protein n=1 Tax=Aegilops tauschii subsp. strangulata TaxID=200361 RepID=A0A453QZK5_AEGTS
HTATHTAPSVSRPTLPSHAPDRARAAPEQRSPKHARSGSGGDRLRRMRAMGLEAGESSSFLSLSSAFSYGVASMAMVFVNKAVIMQYVHSMTLLTLQQLATALFIHFGQVLGMSKRKDLSIATAKKLLPVSIFYNANVAFALASLKGVNIPMYIAIKRLTPLAVLVSGFLRGKGKPSTQVSLSVVCTALGVLVAALGDFSFDLYGYSMALISVFFQTMYLILVEKSGADDGLSSMELMFYNSILSIPFLFFIIVATGEFPHSLSVLSEKDSFCIIQCYSSNFTGDGYCSQLHHVLVHNRKLCPDNHDSRSSQGCRVHDPGFRGAWRRQGARSQRHRAGDQHVRWRVVFVRKVHAEEEAATKGRTRRRVASTQVAAAPGVSARYNLCRQTAFLKGDNKSFFFWTPSISGAIWRGGRYKVVPLFLFFF